MSGCHLIGCFALHVGSGYKGTVGSQAISDTGLQLLGDVWLVFCWTLWFSQTRCLLHSLKGPLFYRLSVLCCFCEFNVSIKLCRTTCWWYRGDWIYFDVSLIVGLLHVRDVLLVHTKTLIKTLRIAYSLYYLFELPVKLNTAAHLRGLLSTFTRRSKI